MKQHAPATPSWLVVEPDNDSSDSRDVANLSNSPQPSADLDRVDAQEFELDIRRFFSAFWTRKWFILGLSGLIFSIAAIFILNIPPSYQATAQILIDPADSLTKIQSVSSPLARDSQAIASEIEIIQSSDIARKLIDAVDFRSYAQTPIPPSKLDSLLGLSPGIVERLKQLRKKTEGLISVNAETGGGGISDTAVMEAYYGTLGVARVSGTYVISINFQTRDPEFSAHAANQLAAIYISSQVDNKRDARRQASTLLTENLTKLESEIQRSNDEVSSFRDQSGINDSPSTELIGQQLTQQTTQLVDARAVAQAIGARIRNLDELRNAGKTEELLSLINSSSAQARWEEVRRARGALATREEDFGPNHPEIIRLTSELEDAQSGLESEMRTAVETMRIEAIVAASKVTELESSILDLRRSMTNLKEKENQLQQLKSDSDISRTLHELLTSRIREAESAVVEGPDARILNLAEAPAYPSSTPKKLLLLGALFAAFTVSGAAALGLEFLNGGYQTEEALRRSLGWPVLATVPKKSGWKFLPKFRTGSKASAYEEAFNVLLTNLEIQGLDFNSDKAVVVMVTSSIPSEGKSTIVRDFACAATEAGNRVLVIDADLRRPTAHKQFNVANTLGLASCEPKLFSDNLVGSLIEQDSASGVDVIPAGDKQVRPQMILKSSIIQQILKNERSNYDLIVLDTPPVLAVSDALVVGKHCDAAIFVVKWSSTARRLVQRAMVRFSKGGVPLAGCVLTQVSKGAHQVGTYQYLDYS